MEILFLIIGIILILCGIYFTWKSTKIKKEIQALQVNKEELIQSINELEENCEVSEQQYLKITQKIEESQKELQTLNVKQNLISNTINQQEKYINSVNSNLDAMLNQRKIERTKALDEELKAYEEQIKEKIQNKKAAADSVIETLEKRLQSEQDKVEATIAAIQSLQSSEEKEKEHMINLSEEDKDDIAFLLNNVGPHLKNPSIIYKLIWSEYIQKASGFMLDAILPDKDCSGIYKITNLNNKKAYIGRSTSVRRRITEHIKSVVGVGTIADQHVHSVMRQEGLWNFKFELVEVCEKDKLGEREKYYIDFFKTQTWGYNIVSGSAYKGE